MPKTIQLKDLDHILGEIKVVAIELVEAFNELPDELVHVHLGRACAGISKVRDELTEAILFQAQAERDER